MVTVARFAPASTLSLVRGGAAPDLLTDPEDPSCHSVRVGDSLVDCLADDDSPCPILVTASYTGQIKFVELLKLKARS